MKSLITILAASGIGLLGCGVFYYGAWLCIFALCAWSGMEGRK